MATELLTLTGGRTLEYLSNGVMSDSAIIFHQGTLADLIGWGGSPLAILRSKEFGPFRSIEVVTDEVRALTIER